MLFWIAAAAVTAAVAAALIAPLFRNRGSVGENESEMAIYRDQLSEVDRDVERGVLLASEAEAARTEIARRLIRASEGNSTGERVVADRRRLAMWIALIIVPIVAVGGYVAFGDPGAEDRPIEARRTNPAADDIYARLQLLSPESSVEELEEVAVEIDAALEDNPENVSLLDAAMTVRYWSGRYEDAAGYYLRLIDLVSDPTVLDPEGNAGASIGVFLLASGELTPTGNDLIRVVADRYPSHPLAALNNARRLIRDGEIGEAEAVLLSIIDAEAGDEQWAEIARDYLRQIGAELPPAPEGGADAGVPPALAGMTPEEQAAFIDQMVSQLAAELEANPDDPEGWAQLIRSYIVLEREDEARAALATARDFFTGNAGALETIEEAAAPLMVEQ